MKSIQQYHIGAIFAAALATVAQAQTNEPPPVSGLNAPADIVRPKPTGFLPRGFYPPIAIRCHWEGTPASELLIDVDGQVADAKITKSSGNATLDQAALAAEKQLHFQPATRNGSPIAVRYVMQLQFKLRDESERERPVPANCPAPPLTDDNSKPN